MWLPLTRYIVAGHSMEPLFKPGDRLIINRLAYLFSKPQVGDIVAIRHRDKILLKKIEKVLGDIKYFVVGSNKTDSFDSSSFGPIHRSQILGKILTKY